MPRVGLKFVIVTFSGHTHLFFHVLTKLLVDVFTCERLYGAYGSNESTYSMMLRFVRVITRLGLI